MEAQAAGRRPVRCHRIYGRSADHEQISREDQTDTVPGSGVRQDFHLLHKCPGHKPVEGSRTIPQQVADRAVLQMAEAAPEG